jgi:hypothetical protein
MGASIPFSAGKETKLKQNSLLACTKSYVASNTAASLPGLHIVSLGPVNWVNPHTTLQTSP